MPKNRDALKFFQAYIKEMIDVGGINLPKSISASLGAKLGKLLKQRGISGLENTLKRIYNVLNAKTQIKTIDDNTMEITLRYRSRFCPLGGKYNPDRAELIQNTICNPYTVAILNTTHPEYKYSAKIMECILNSNQKNCKYRLVKELKSIDNN
ncbi:MAG: hypothetical protein KAV01_00580 [Candidatus Lokiarchaeota archaeon]|nr:hypothetical protein [Candidatus Lokiarchaeota archaeon]